MAIDFNSYLGNVTRAVHDLEKDGKPVRAVIMARVYDTDKEDLWDAVTNPERLNRWFLPISGDLRVGGQYQFEGNAGGTVTACDKPAFISATWEFAGGVSWVEVRIEPDGEGRSRLTLSHICPVDEHWKTYGPGAVGVGWDSGLIGLAVHLGGNGSERFDEAAFMGSESGKDHITRVSEDWGRAAIAAGEDPEHARLAARRTAAFYRGEEFQEG